jgi:hypothetical protein
MHLGYSEVERVDTSHTADHNHLSEGQTDEWEMCRLNSSNGSGLC